MYTDVRNLKYRTDSNIARIIDKYLWKPPQKELNRHPRDCLCGGHMKILIREKRVPYSKIVEEIRRNKYHPPK